MVKNWLVIVVIGLLVGIAVYQNIDNRQSQNSSVYAPVKGRPSVQPKVNHTAPAILLDTLDEKSLSWQPGDNNKPAVINFWASWCGPCELEAPDLQQMYEEYGDEFDLIAVNITDKEHTQVNGLKDVEAFVKEYEFTFPILLDRKGKVQEDYQVIAYPTSFFVDRKGVIREIIYGAADPRTLENHIKKLIRTQ